MRMLDQDGAPVSYRFGFNITGEEVAGSEVVTGVQVVKADLTPGKGNQGGPPEDHSPIVAEAVVKEDVPTVLYSKPYYTSPINDGSQGLCGPA